jgi:nitroreductase
MVSPGMFQFPAAAIAICIDWKRVDALGVLRTNKGVYIDVGTAAQTMLLSAHALGLGSGVVTSFSHAGAASSSTCPSTRAPG